MASATTLSPRPPLRSAQTSHFQTAVCPQCGIALPHFHDSNGSVDAQKRIVELESQVNVLTSKATAAVDKLADYEDELRRLKAAAQQNNPSAANVTFVPPSADEVQRPSSEGNASTNPNPDSNTTTTSRPQHSRFPSLFNYRRAATSSAVPTISRTSDPPSLPDNDPSTLRTALEQEKDLRKQAESKVTQVNSELEELSAQLFQQANEMVSQERRARAQLEERLSGTEQRLRVAEEAAELERRAREELQGRVRSAEERVGVLEKRDREKKGRLERLEKAMGRIERVRGVLKEGGG
ncbi:MAG: exosome 3'-_5 exonuclease subunit ski4 (Csl4) [Bogoriella megaspora]|nr:MAG: exosome 3'->5 exonuclease subunit ski4 (Csl4) [Bogoriella megaspora]